LYLRAEIDSENRAMRILGRIFAVTALGAGSLIAIGNPVDDAKSFKDTIRCRRFARQRDKSGIDFV
jgi:hypothetical protein